MHGTLQANTVDSFLPFEVIQHKIQEGMIMNKGWGKTIGMEESSNGWRSRATFNPSPVDIAAWFVLEFGQSEFHHLIAPLFWNCTWNYLVQGCSTGSPQGLLVQLLGSPHWCSSDTQGVNIAAFPPPPLPRPACCWIWSLWSFLVAKISNKGEEGEELQRHTSLSSGVMSTQRLWPLCWQATVLPLDLGCLSQEKPHSPDLAC